MAIDHTIEVVDGTIIDGGSLERRACLYNERGVRQHKFYFSTDENPESIAQEWWDKKVLEYGEDEIKRIWPNGLELRIYED